MDRNILIGGFMVIALAIAAFPVSQVLAENNNSGFNYGQTMKAQNMLENMTKMMSKWDGTFGKKIENTTEQSVVMRPNGDFRVTGATVNSVNTGANTVNVSFYGFTRDVNVGSAKIYGAGNTISLGEIKAGDKLVGVGNFNASNRSITVSEIYDVTMASAEVSNIQARIQELMNMVNQLQQQLRTLLGR